MDKNLISENNKLIAEFDGYIYHKRVLDDDSDCGGLYEWRDVYSKVPIEVDDYPEEEQCYFKDDWCWKNLGKYKLGYLKYHESWDELIPIIEKIESIPFNLHSVTELCKVYISKNNEINDQFYYCQIWINEDTQFSVEDKSYSKIESVWFVVVEFIKWYTEHSK